MTVSVFDGFFCKISFFALYLVALFLSPIRLSVGGNTETCRLFHRSMYQPVKGLESILSTDSTKIPWAIRALDLWSNSPHSARQSEADTESVQWMCALAVLPSQGSTLPITGKTVAEFRTCIVVPLPLSTPKLDGIYCLVPCQLF
jgi:hypothetical protein